LGEFSNIHLAFPLGFSLAFAFSLDALVAYQPCASCSSTRSAQQQ
jgi:hypothetical protein